MAVLPASPGPLGSPASRIIERLRPWALILGAAFVVLVFVPPLATESARYYWVEALQFCLIAYAIPALFAVGRPWRWLARRGGHGRLWAVLERFGARRVRHPSYFRAFAFASVDAVLLILWRTPAWTDAVVRHRWLVAVELVSLLVAGMLLWLEVIDCPPLRPRLHRPWRAVLATLAMWASWVMSFAIGFSHESWYHVYDHVGSGIGVVLDQEIGTAVVWVAAVCTFLPAIFVDIMTWLRNDEDPDAEMRKLVRAARRSGTA